MCTGTVDAAWSVCTGTVGGYSPKCVHCYSATRVFVECIYNMTKYLVRYSAVHVRYSAVHVRYSAVHVRCM